MRQEFLDRLKVLMNERSMKCMRLGWVYGMLRQEFNLQPDELEEMARRMKFKKGWNPMLKSLLEDEWEKEKASQENIAEIRRSRLQTEQRAVQVQNIERSLGNNVHAKKSVSDTEMALFLLISEMSPQEQEQLLEELSKRPKVMKAYLESDL